MRHVTRLFVLRPRLSGASPSDNSIPGGCLRNRWTLSLPQAIVYEGQDKNPEMCRVLLTHEVMCR